MNDDILTIINQALYNARSETYKDSDRPEHARKVAGQIAALVEQREEAAIDAFLDTLPANLFSEHTTRQIREWADEWRQG